MPRISNFIYCLNAITSDIETNAIGVLSAITPEYVPGAFSFSILCSIMDLEEGNHNISMKFMSPEENVLVDIDAIVPYEKNDAVNLPKEQVGLNISTNLQNVVFEKAGMYKTKVSIDGILYGTYEIYVKGKNEGA